MNATLFCLSLLPAANPVRITFDVQIFYEQRNVLASMALNQSADGRMSIACRKLPGGTLFTYWGTEQRNVLWFPKGDVAFEGRVHEPFGIFPGGPEMTRENWLTVLMRGPAGDVGTFAYQKDEAWHMLADHDAQIIIRWRESKRRTLTQLPERALVPRVADDAVRYPFSQFTQYWSHHGFE